jgi:hypothetical protein
MTKQNSVSKIACVITTVRFKFLITYSQFTSFILQRSKFQLQKRKVEWISGINFLSDVFTQDKHDTIIPVNYNQNTIGAFVPKHMERFEDYCT